MNTTADTLQVRLTSSVELMRASVERYLPWIEQTLGVPLDQTVSLEVDSNPGDAVAAHLLGGIALTADLKRRSRSWQELIQGWKLPAPVAPLIVCSTQRERKPNAPPARVWDLDWQDCPVAFTLKGLSHRVVSVKVPVVYPPGDSFTASFFKHWLIVHREDAAKVLLLIQQVESKAERYLETAHGRMRLDGRYDWNAVVLDATARRMVRTDFELFFQREAWFRHHNLPYRRGYLLWGLPGNGKSATIRIMAAHPHIKAYAIDLSDVEEKSRDLHIMFEQAAEHTPALIVLEDLDRAFPTEGKWTRERTVSFQSLLNCLDGVGTQDGVIVVATANDPTCLDPAILKRPGRFDRVVHFRNPDAELRREYYRKLNPALSGKAFEAAVHKTEGFSFAQLRETYIMGAQSAFEHGREVTFADVMEAIELQAAGAYELKAVRVGSGFVGGEHPVAKRRKAEAE